MTCCLPFAPPLLPQIDASRGVKAGVYAYYTLDYACVVYDLKAPYITEAYMTHITIVTWSIP